MVRGRARQKEMPWRIKRVPFILKNSPNHADRIRREYQRVSGTVLAIGVLVGAGIAAEMVHAEVEWWIVVVASLVLFGVILVIATCIATLRTAPVTKTGSDRSRGVVRLGFRNPGYVPLVGPQMEAGGGTK